MLKLTADEIRESYLKFFEEKKHLRMPSFSLVPVDDPTLLLIGAGMAPLKAYFKGEAKPPSTRITNSQKCVRADDIEFVGKTARHHTFFEMLGNFSFGDYYKKEAIQWAWEYFVDILKLPEEKLYVSVHTNDDDAADIWLNSVGIPREKLCRLDSNFWGPIGLTGPCGSCSEIMVDQGERFSCGKPDCKPGCDCDRYLELWNLVFPGLNKNESGEYEDLPKPGIDTGLGFERLVAYMQGKKNDFETELFVPLTDVISDISGVRIGDSAEGDMALKIIADHCRAVIFMACDGITPSNEGRGYVMRRLMRRAVRFAREINFGDNTLTVLVDPLISIMGHVYPGLKEKRDYAISIMKTEESNFRRTLNQGMALLDNLLEHLNESGEKVLPGKDMFSLYDTYGFPPEMTMEIAEERGFEIDRDGFDKSLEKQRKRAREAVGKKMGDMEAEVNLSGVSSIFTGYDKLSEETTISALFRKGKKIDILKSGEVGEVVFELTCFYGESGGQVGDTGIFRTDKAEGDITYTHKTPADINLHIVKVEKGEISTGDRIQIEVTGERRKEIARHHSATHLLQSVLRDVLGTHVSQMGSLVEARRLRFDFSHHGAMTPDEIREVEIIVNKKILENAPVVSEELPLNEALKEGALAFFGEKYDERVRVVSMGDFSTELCGGTHVCRTGDIGCFKIISESAVGMGTRRIESVCGMAALERFQGDENLLKTASVALATDFKGLADAILKQKENIKSLEKDLQSARNRVLKDSVSHFVAKSDFVEGVPYVARKLEGVSRDDLRNTADMINDRMKTGIIILGTVIEGKVALVVKVTDDLVKKGISAVPIVRGISKTVGGSGGGKPNMAQAGGKNPERLDEAVSKAELVIKEEIDKMKVTS
ncbi:MAG: alanine--tRNA ligase [Candidatus Eremiobacteraeota bacterium]|nr:alanine--tRNA ligase [Candidatus Eremiobacteraeota bacterium]